MENGSSTIQVVVFSEDPGVVDVVRRACSTDPAMDCIEAASPLDVDLRHVHIAVVEGADLVAIAQLRSITPSPAVLALFDPDVDIATFLSVVRTGAAGMLDRTASPAEMADDLRRAARGYAVLSPDRLEALVAATEVPERRWR